MTDADLPRATLAVVQRMVFNQTEAMRQAHRVGVLSDHERDAMMKQVRGEAIALLLEGGWREAAAARALDSLLTEAAQRSTEHANPFSAASTAPSPDLPAAWRPHIATAGAFLLGILLSDLLFGAGFTLFGILSLAARVMLLLNGVGLAFLGVVQLASKRRAKAQEWLVTGLVLAGVSIVSTPQLFLLDWLLDLE